MGLFRTREERQEDRQDRQDARQEDRAARQAADLSGSENRQQRRDDRQGRDSAMDDLRAAGSAAWDDFTGATAIGDAADAEQAAIDQALAELGYVRDPETGEMVPPATAAPSPLDPYTNAGAGAVDAQGDLLGLNGPEAQQAAIAALQTGPAYTSMMDAGENSILQNASATGGLRGGNTQAALGELGPQVLSMLMQNQIGNLGGVAGVGAGAAGGQAGLDAANSAGIVDLLTGAGGVEAEGILGENQSAWTMYQDLLGMLAGFAGG